MASPKQYKNVYTILEKVKKGEIQSHYKDRDGLFGKINFYKKTDLIKPYMHYIDEGRLSTIVRSYVDDPNSISSDYQKFVRSRSFDKIADDKKPDYQAFSQKLSETYKKFPNHLKNDIFKMFYHKMDKLDFAERTDTNYGQYKFLERANNPVSKIMTETSNLKSSIFTRNLMKYFAMQLTMMEYVDPDAAKDIMNGLNGNSEFDNENLDKLMKDMLDNKLAKNMLDDAIKDATDTCKSMDESMSKDIQESMFDSVKDGGGGAAKLGPDYLRRVTEDIRRINLSLGSLKEKIKKLMDRSVSYFSAKKETIYEDLFNSDNLAGLDEYTFLHPKLRKIMVEDIVIKDTKSIGKIDIYIDISGSMSDGCGVKDKEGNNINKLDFCKAFALKLQEMDLLNKIYVFNTSVRNLKTDIFSIASLSTSGGTCIDSVVEHINKNDSNALILTDAEDRCRSYSDRAFFIGINGARFNHFNNEIIEKYSTSGQVVVFDGTRMYKVDTKGYVIN